MVRYLVETLKTDLSQTIELTTGEKKTTFLILAMLQDIQQ
jgi:hypothetical protein